MAVIPAQVRSTFHYPGCGCGTRPWCGNQIDWMWSDQSLGLPAAVRARPLRVCYYLPHHNVTGGMKMLIKHLVHLQRRGHWVMAAFRGPIGSPVLPPWAREMLTPDAERLILPHENITAVLGDVDVVMLGYFTQLVELGDATACPGAIVYWDQGHEHVFGDPTSHADWDRVFHASMHLPVSLLSVSNIVRDILAHHFARVAPVVPNAIDSSLFHPGPEPPHHPMRIAGRFPVDPTGPRRVLIVGNPGLRLKNFDTALAVLARVHRWLLDEAEDIPALYRSGFDCILFCSAYEAWGMPVLEAMASGVPVVTSRCHGVDMFASHRYNCLSAEPFDVDALARCVYAMVTRPALQATFARRAREVARRTTWPAAMSSLEAALYHVDRCIGKVPLMPGAWPPQASAAPGFVQPALFGTASGAFVSAGQGLGGAVPFAAPGAGGTVDAHR